MCDSPIFSANILRCFSICSSNAATNWRFSMQILTTKHHRNLQNHHYHRQMIMLCCQTIVKSITTSICYLKLIFKQLINNYLINLAQFVSNVTQHLRQLGRHIYQLKTKLISCCASVTINFCTDSTILSGSSHSATSYIN